MKIVGKRIAACLLLAALLSSLFMTGCDDGKKAEEDDAAGKKTVTDMAGRELTVPEKVDCVYAASPVGSLLMYTINDEKMAGLNYDLYEEEKEYTTEYYRNLPNLGGWFGQGKTGNVEEIIKIKPDIVLSSGLSETAVTDADALQKQLGIPVVLFDDSLEELPEVYRFIGDLTGDKERAETLADYCAETIKSAQDIAETIPENEKVRVYYAEETEGLNTDPAGSPHARLIDLCGGINVADVEMQGGYGRSQVSMEQVIAWNPQLIVSCIDNGYKGSASYENIMDKETWQQIDAVKNKEVFQTPTIPFNWFDRPPSVNTIIGIKWFQNLLYPKAADYDIKEEAKEFYKLFYHVEIDDKDVELILDKALRQEIQ